MKNRKAADSQKLETKPESIRPLGELITLRLLIRMRQGGGWWKAPIWPISTAGAPSTLDGSLLKEERAPGAKGTWPAAGNLPPGPSRPGGRLLSQLQLLLETAGPMGAEGYGRRERPPGAGSSRKRRDSCLLFLGPKAQSPAAQTPHLPPDAPSAPSGGSGNRARGGAREATPTRGLLKVPHSRGSSAHSLRLRCPSSARGAWSSLQLE